MLSRAAARILGSMVIGLILLGCDLPDVNNYFGGDGYPGDTSSDPLEWPTDEDSESGSFGDDGSDSETSSLADSETATEGGTDTDSDTGPFADSESPGWEYCVAHHCLTGAFPTGFGPADCFDEILPMDICPGNPGSVDCYSTDNGFCGQDAQYADVEREMIVSDPQDNGQTIVEDTLTGLIWQQNYVRGKAWTEALLHCDELEYAGHADWRLPEVWELRSFVWFGGIYPAIDRSVFPAHVDGSESIGGLFWSRTPGGDGRRWRADFTFGVAETWSEPVGLDARCVRGGALEDHTADSLREIVVDEFPAEPIVVDDAYGLTWQKHHGERMSWKDALRYCEKSAYSGITNWRLPKINELYSLVSHKMTEEAPATFFPGIGSDRYWSSTTLRWFGREAWYVQFDPAQNDWALKTELYRPLCVMDGRDVLLEVDTDGVGFEGDTDSETASDATEDTGGIEINDTDSQSDDEYCSLYHCLPGAIPTGYASDACYGDWDGPQECLGSGGSDDCYALENEYCGQDGQYPDGHRDFTLEDPASDGQLVVNDSFTGLIWQKEFAGPMHWYDAMTYCSDLSYGGYDDWRLPELAELRSIIHYGSTTPMVIDTNSFDFFDGGSPALDDKFWTATASSFQNYWTVEFYDGIGGTEPYPWSNYVRCVRGHGLSNHPAERFIEVTLPEFTDEPLLKDHAYELAWQKSPGEPMDWKSALRFCEQSVHSGFTDWRLPNITELQSLLTTKTSSVQTHFPGIGFDRYWSSSPNALATVPYGRGAWYVLFSTGFIGKAGLNLEYLPLCVRDGFDISNE